MKIKQNDVKAKDRKQCAKDIDVAMSYVNMVQDILSNVLDSLNETSYPQGYTIPVFNSQLDYKKTFKNFIKGNCNKLSRTLALSIPENLGNPTRCPFYIYGPSGCGKTHLVNAIGVRCKEMHPDKRVLYVSARTFQMQFTDANIQGRINDFIGIYQSVDVLIVDDIQEWMNSPKTLDTFFYIFNHLIHNGKQIILASNCPPVKLQGMDEQLIERFACGVIVELEKPNEQLCINILKNKCQRDELKIPADVMEYIAKSANGSVCFLEGLTNSLMAKSIVLNYKVDMHLVKSIMNSMLS